MKRIFISVVIMAMVMVCSMRAYADLNLIGQGTSADGTWNLIYDTDYDITWYDYTRDRYTWQSQVDWADALSVNFGGHIYDEWRLPSSDMCTGYNCTGSEMGHLYYTELGNMAGGPLSNTGDFQNLQAKFYWSGTDHRIDPSYAMYFHDSHGYQHSFRKNSFVNAIAVYPGQIAVMPEPISSTLFLIGGATLGVRRFRKWIK